MAKIFHRVIDVSYYQGDIDFKKVKSAGYTGVILRIGLTGYGSQKLKRMDSMFEKNYEAAKSAGLSVGGYWYSCAYDELEAIEEANLVIQYTKGKQFEFPIYWDTEDNHDTNVAGSAKKNQSTIGKSLLTDCAIAFCNRLEKNGYFVGIYASKSWFLNQLEIKRLTNYAKWIAHYTDSPIDYSKEYGIWQYSSKGVVPGISGNVDLNYCYVDYPKIIKENQLNGYQQSIDYQRKYEECLREIQDLKKKVNDIHALSEL